MKTDVVKVIFRRLRLIRIDRNFLVFLVFLAVSIGFWFLQTLKEDMTVSMNYKLTITDVPRNAIFTSDVPNEVKVNFSGHGWNILQNMMRNESREIEISFDDLSTSNGTIVIDQATLQRAAVKKLPRNLRFASTSPNRIEIFYSNGMHKKVPVVFSGKITTEESRIQCGILFAPDSVDIYAPQHLLDEISSISTIKQSFSNLGDTIVCKIPLDVPKGMKALPDSVSTTICVDLFTERQSPCQSIAKTSQATRTYARSLFKQRSRSLSAQRFTTKCLPTTSLSPSITTRSTRQATSARYSCARSQTR